MLINKFIKLMKKNSENSEKETYCRDNLNRLWRLIYPAISAIFESKVHNSEEKELIQKIQSLHSNIEYKLWLLNQHQYLKFDEKNIFFSYICESSGIKDYEEESFRMITLEDFLEKLAFDIGDQRARIEFFKEELESRVKR